MSKKDDKGKREIATALVELAEVPKGNCPECHEADLELDQIWEVCPNCKYTYHALCCHDCAGL